MLRYSVVCTVDSLCLVYLLFFIHFFIIVFILFLYSNQTVRPSVRPSVPLRVRCISPIFFEIGILNLVCGCILGWRSVVYHFRVAVTLTLTSDLVFYSNHNVRPSFPLRVRCISPIFFEVGIPNLMCGCILGWRSVAYHFRVTVTLTLTLT